MRMNITTRMRMSKMNLKLQKKENSKMNADLEYIMKNFEDVKIIGDPQLGHYLRMTRFIMENKGYVGTSKFEDIHHIDHILHNIGSSLPLKDYINFSMVNKKTYNILAKKTKHNRRSMIKWAYKTYREDYYRYKPNYNLICTKDTSERMSKQRINKKFNFTGKIYKLFAEDKDFNFPFDNLQYHYKTLTFLIHAHKGNDIIKFLKDNVENFYKKVDRIILCCSRIGAFVVDTRGLWSPPINHMYFVDSIKERAEEFAESFKKYSIELIFAKENWSNNSTIGVEFYAEPY